MGAPEVDGAGVSASGRGESYVASPPVTPRRVAITGISVATALGLTTDAFWAGLLDGRPAISRLALADEHDLPVRIAGQVDDAALAEACGRFEIKDPDRSSQFALVTAGAALECAGLPTDGSAPLHLDAIVASGHGTVVWANESAQTFAAHGYRKMRPTTVLRAMFNRPASLLSIRYGLAGGSHAVSAACASASVALGEAFTRIRFGLSRGAVVAATDCGLEGATVAAWNRLGVLSKIEDPSRASRPFDVARDGIVMSEGAAALVLEDWESARARGATILAEMVGYGCSSDAHHIIRPHAAGQIPAVRSALTMAGLEPRDIDYVNAHGTGTELADQVECESLHAILGEHAERVPVSTTKGQLGHFMGATAGVELVATILAMRAGVIPPCRNLDDLDPLCDLAFVRHEPLEVSLRTALKSTFAFGGSNSAVVLRRAE